MTNKEQKTRWRWRVTYPDGLRGHLKKVLYDTDAEAFTAAAYHADSRVDKLLFMARTEAMFEIWRDGERLGSARYTNRMQADTQAAALRAEVREVGVELWRRVDPRDFHRVALPQQDRDRKATRGKQRRVK